MEEFAQEMACIVCRLFPDDNDDDKENIPPIDHQDRQQKKHPSNYTHGTNENILVHLDNNNFNINKRRRPAAFAKSTAFPLKEVRNGAANTTKNTTVRTSTTNQLYRSKGGVLTIKVDNIIRQGCVPLVNQASKDNFVIADDSKVKITEEPPSIKSSSVANPNTECASSANDFLEHFDYVLTKRYAEGTDFLLIRDVIFSDDDDNRDGASSEINLDELSNEQLTTIRVLIVPIQRQETMDQMGKLILGTNFGRNNIPYDRNFWFSVLKSYDTFKMFYAQESSDLATRFNLLFGFTFHLSNHPHWMNHHARGWGGEKMVSGLANKWKQLMRCLPGHMGLDIEYSYPAVLCFLEEFKTTVESVNTYGDPKLQFDYER
jgi:hypothetical protein